MQPKILKSNLMKHQSINSNRQIKLKMKISIMTILESKNSKRETPLKSLILKLIELLSKISTMELNLLMQKSKPTEIPSIILITVLKLLTLNLTRT
jgi:hypothetical protein